MTKERWALVLMGAWIAGTVFVTVVATQNFHTVDRLLAGSDNAAFSAVVDELGPQRARDLLRYLSSELNRLYFQWWNVLQVVLGAAVLWLTARRPDARSLRVGVTAMLAVVVVMLAWMTPEITAIGRRLDFVSRDPAPPELSRFWVLHAAYTALEVAKLGAAVFIAARLSVQRSLEFR